MSKKTANSQTDGWAVGWMIRGLVIVMILAAFLVPMGGMPIIAVATQADGDPIVATGPITYRLTTPVPDATTIPPTPTPDVISLGIVIGHGGYDSGAVCPDGLQEVQVNTQIARHVAQLGEARGWRVELLDEFDDRLTNYQADALLSIHADSCTFPGKTGFKLARSGSSHIPEQEDRLVQCISQYYAQITGLVFDPHTITDHMTFYHAFDRVALDTPAAIIETGFMLDDRALLSGQPDLVAQGIVEGLACFLEGSD